tara:strand:+ start:2961 stop:3251 length:291 start_codon:yes stop_codon:yes gene_type:complete
MKDQLIDIMQGAASGKTALVIGGSIATAPNWINFIQGDMFKTVIIMVGLIVSISIILINLQSFKQRLIINQEIQEQERIRTALLKHQAHERNIKVG